ncbi:hypothetical protein HUK65_07405 [Rhodobacteraceae bacterium 2376]|uniref:Bacterial Ig-like domain-containing protein n=1 Tax=Rhabdonatronobacter sediminivivens TaxID=2743469 RepID=A0A7Z0KZY1_9RHOB|nr:hypothetical protein [Rhabdonatronobacter sediminivivens]NYS24818.1 hypothetical protein [Rhabdonatronobacter sediminivivens]
MKDFSTGTEGSEFNKVTRDAKRRAYIQDWIARNQRVLAAGIGTGVLALPLIAQGATSDFVSLSSIHGIRSAQEQADGSLRLTLSNGQQVVLQPDDVIMGKSGEIMISQEAADMIDGLVTVDETAVGGGAGLAVAALAGLTLAAAALARSSSDDDDAAPPPPPPPLPVVNRDDVAGLVFDDVFDEPAPDGSDRITATIGEGDAAVSTMGVLGDDGVWRFAFDPDDLTALQGEQQIAFLAESEVLDDDGDGTGEFDELGSGATTVFVDTIAPVIDITEVAGSDNVLNAEERDDALVVAGTTDAEDGQEVTVDVLDGDGAVVATGTATAQDGEWSVEIDASGLDDDAAYTLRASVEDVNGNAADPAEADLQTDFTAEVTIAPIDDLTTVNTFFDLEITGGTNGVEEGASVFVTFAGNDYGPAAVGADGSWSVTVPQADIEALGDDVTEVVVTASVTDAAGNSDDASQNVAADFSAPGFAVTSPTDDVVRDVDNIGEDLTISGVSVPGSEVVVSIDGEARDAVTVAADGTWSDTIPSDDLPGDGTYEISVQGTLEGVAVAPPATLGLMIDTRPQITFDAIGEDGALIIDDLGDTITFSGATRGVEADQEVTVSVDEGAGFSDVGTATVQADGTWSLTVDTEIDGSEVGNEITFRAEVSNAAGRAATPAEESVVGYAYSNYEMFETGRDGDTITVSIFGIDEAFPDGLTAFDVQTTIDPDVVNYGGYPSDEHPGFFFILGNPADGPGVGTMSGVVQVTGAGEVPITDFSIALAQIETVLQDGDDVVEIGLTGVGSGATQLILGSDGADTLVAGNTDAVIRGRGGDDQIDLSAPGSNTVVFEGGSVANGFDTVTGFTLGGALADRISISFDTFGQDELRGNGTDFQVTDGGALGADVGLLVFTTAVADLDDDAAIADAVGSSITGLAENENIYLMIGDGTDAILTAIEGTDGGVSVSTGSGTAYARFEGMGDLSGFSSANVLGFEQFNG